MEQPERGHYDATGRGRMTFYLACLFPQLGEPVPDVAGREAALDLGEEDTSAGR